MKTWGDVISLVQKHFKSQLAKSLVEEGAGTMEMEEVEQEDIEDSHQEKKAKK